MNLIVLNQIDLFKIVFILILKNVFVLKSIKIKSLLRNFDLLIFLGPFKTMHAQVFLLYFQVY